MNERVELISDNLSWIKTDIPEEYNGKQSWSVTAHLNPDGVNKVMELKAEGVKNVLKKDDKGWYVKFSRPVVQKNKEGKVTKQFNPPVVSGPDGTIVNGMVANGATGTVVLDVYQHPVQGGGKAKAARLEGIKLNTWTMYGS